MIEKFEPKASRSGGPYLPEETKVMDAYFRGDFPAFIEGISQENEVLWSDGAIVQINKYIDLYNDQPILPPVEEEPPHPPPADKPFDEDSKGTPPVVSLDDL